MINNNKLLNFLQKYLGQYKKYSGEEYYFKCPLCGRFDDKKKLAIKLDYNDKKTYMNWHCWIDPSHKGRNIFQLIKQMGLSNSAFIELKSIVGYKNNNIDIQNFNDKINFLLNKKNESITETIRLPKEFIKLSTDIKSLHGKAAYRYLIKRGLTDKDILKYNLGYCEEGNYKNYVIVPSYDNNMNLNYFVSRSFYDTKMKYKNPPYQKDIIFNDMYINWNEDIILCEGIFDMFAIKRNAIPILGKYIKSNLKYKILQKRVKNIYVALDSDAISDSIKIIEEFMKNDINVYFVELDKKDPSEMGYNGIWDSIKNSKLMNLNELIKLKLKL